ncbi:MAG: cupin [Pseudorhodobacter sp.]|nr:cupin [Frankiaceae bacterium]
MSECVDVTEGLDWGHFVRTWWDRAPVLLRGVSSVPFIESEVFRAAAAATALGGRLSVPLTSMVVEGVQGATAALLPVTGDGGFDGYERRVAAQLPAGARYAVTTPWFHCLDEALWTRERHFLAPLWELVGLPVTGAITTMFHGPYTSTPVGVHKDRFATCMVGLRGRKRMRFWSARPWSSDASSVQDYAEHLDSSFTADVGPGDVLYWPAGYYHVGEGLGGIPATSVNIGLPRTEHTARYEVQDLLTTTPFRTLVDPSTAAATGYPAVTASLRASGPDTTGRLPAELPPAFQQAAGLLSDPRLSAHAREVSQRRWAAGGLQPTPEESPRS